MIYTVFIDESGTHHDSPVMTLAGYLGRLGQWQHFDKRWAKLLNRHNLTYHHSKEMFHRQGQYKNWTYADGLRFIDRAGIIAQQSSLCGLTVRLTRSDYKNFYITENRITRVPQDTMYGICFRIFVSFLPGLLRRSSSHAEPQINFILEDGAEGIGNSDIVFQQIKTKGPPELVSLLGTRSVGEKKKFYGLQAADCLAYASFQVEQKNVDFIDCSSDVTIQDAQRASGLRAPIFRIDANEEFLRSHRLALLDYIERRKSGSE